MSSTIDKKLTARIPIGFTQKEKETYEKLAETQKLPSFAALVRVALDFYARKANAPQENNMQIILDAQKKELANILAQIEEKMTQYVRTASVEEISSDKKGKIILNIIKYASTHDGINTGEIVLQTGFSRVEVIEICLNLQKVGTIGKKDNNWVIV